MFVDLFARIVYNDGVQQQNNKYCRPFLGIEKSQRSSESCDRKKWKAFYLQNGEATLADVK